MKLTYLASLLALTATTAFSEPITWTPVTSGSTQWSNSQTAPRPPVSFMPIGPQTYGSNGSSSYQTGNTTSNSDGSSGYRNGNIVTGSDGTRSMQVGELTYVQRPDGSQYLCSKVGEQTICKPR